MSSKELEHKTEVAYKENTAPVKGSRVSVSMREMLKAGVHFGHQTRYWNPKMKPYIFGARNNVHIINLEKTVPLFNDALHFLTQVSSGNGRILFIGTKRAASQAIKEAATSCNQFYVNNRWLGGMLTNWKTVRQAIKRLKNLEQQSQDGTFQKLSKKECLMLQREHEKLNNSLGGIKEMGGLPDAIFVIDADHEHIAVTEARQLGIPVVAVVDTNTNPDGIDYIIPGNDDAVIAIRLYLKAAAEAIVTGNASFHQEKVNQHSNFLEEIHPPRNVNIKTMKSLNDCIVSFQKESILNQEILSLCESSPIDPIEIKFSLSKPLSIKKFDVLLESFSNEELAFSLKRDELLDLVPKTQLALLGIHLNTQTQFSFGQYLEIKNKKAVTKPKYLDFIDSKSDVNEIDVKNEKIMHFYFDILIVGVLL